MKAWLWISLLFLVTFEVFAQEQSPLGQLSLSSVASSRYAPANLGTDFTKIQVSFNAYAWVGNTTFTKEDFLYFQENGEDAIYAIDKLKSGKNRAGAGAMLEPFHVGYMLTKEKKIRRGTHSRKVRCPGEYFSEEVMTFSFGVTERVAESITFPGEPIKEVFSGDSTFSSSDLAFFARTNGYYVREWAAGMAMPINLPKLKKYFPGVRYRFGARVKYLQGIAGVFTRRNNGSFHSSNGVPQSLDYDYKYYVSYDEDNFNPFKSSGYGFATDLGLYFNYKNVIDGDINILDLGFLRFNQNASSYIAKGTIDDPLNVSTDDIEEILEDSKTENVKFTMPYSTQLRFDIGYNLMSYTYDSIRYAHHRISFTYVQGLTRIGNNTFIPYLSGMYTYNAFNLVEMGVNISYSGFTRPPEFGAVLGLNLKHVHVAVGSSNVSHLIKSYGTGADLFVNFTVTF